MAKRKDFGRDVFDVMASDKFLEFEGKKYKPVFGEIDNDFKTGGRIFQKYQDRYEMDSQDILLASGSRKNQWRLFKKVV